MSQPHASSPAGSAAGTPGSTAATADGNPSTPAKLSLGQLHTQIPAIFQRARTGNMSAAQAHQFRIMLYKSLPNLIVHSLKTGRPNPFIDIPDLLNPSVSSEGYTANITPEQYQHRIQLTEHEARKKLIKSGDLPPDNTTEVAGASEGTSGDAQGEGGNGENGGTDASTSANTLAPAHASASGDMQGVPARTASPAFQNLPTSEVINIFRMTNAERDEAFKRDPVLQNRYNLTLHKVLATTRKQQNPGTAAAISAAIAALTPGSSSGSVGAASTGTSSPHIPGAGSATGTDDTGQGSTAASITAENVLPDASNFNLSLPPSVKAKKGLSNASNPSKAEDSSTLDGHSGNDETVKLEETDMDLDSRFGADPSVDMGRSTDMEAASGSGSSHGHALAAGRGKGSGNGVGSGPVELPSPFNLSSGSGGGSSSTNAAGASGSGPYAQLNYSARGQAGQDTYPGNRSGLPEGARSVGWERSTGTMGLQQGKQAAAPIQPSLRPQPLPLEPESARRKRKVREMLGEVAPGMEMEVGVDEVFEEYIEEFLRDLIRGGAELAKHRNVNGIELKDVGLYMQHRFNVSVPGYETLIPHKPSMPVGEPDRKARAKGIVPGYNRKPNGDTQGIPGGGA